MKEDLIEVLTSLVFKEKMSKLITAFARVITKDKEKVFIEKLNELRELTPKSIGVGSFFCLDKYSKIEDIFIN